MNCCVKHEREGERERERKKEREAAIGCETRAGLRHVGTLGRLIIWCSFKPLFFKLFRPKTGLVCAKTADNIRRNSFAYGTRIYRH